MAGTKARRPTPEAVVRWIQQGYGQGEGKSYKPFFNVRDVPSEGTSSMVWSRITGRTHMYLSRHEFCVHLLAEYSRSTLDIREQFALLPWGETQTLASQVGIRHPIYPGTKTPIVLTTDFVLTLERPDGMQLVSVSAKLNRDLTARSLEKLLLERLYWNRRGIRWILITEDNLPATLCSNLMFFEGAFSDERVAQSPITATAFSRAFEAHWQPALSFGAIMRRTIATLGLDEGTGHSLLGRAIWERESFVDIANHRLSHRSTVRLKG